MEIKKLSVESVQNGCVTDVKAPRFSFYLESDQENVALAKAEISVNDWKVETNEQIQIPYGGEALKPFTTYTVTVKATDTKGETDEKSTCFMTGKMGTPWTAKWITDGSYVFNEKGTSPVPMVFRKKICTEKKVAKAIVVATAMGIFDLALNGTKIGEDYFAPGFTSYKTRLQYVTYDMTDMVKDGENVFTATVAGGWAVGAFVFTRVNKYYADRQALLCEIHLTYEDGTTEVVATDTDWEVTEEGNVRMADLYDGETYDATIDMNAVAWKKATVETLKINPSIYASIGAPVRRHELMKPVSVTKAPNGEILYDFGQNFAGVICMKINGKKGQVVVARHAEVLDSKGNLLTKLLRSAKATATYTCVDGEQVYSPTLSYMGFRYVGLSGIEEQDVELCAYALYSEIEHTGFFTCSDERVNKLQSNILWSSRSNFVEIPTDCPQRDERMGWTGDIAVFSPTACFNFDMRRFLEKWLGDVRAEQNRGGGIPNTVPVHGYGFPATMPRKAIAFWGDACVFVPWALYLAYGDKNVLKENYNMMKKYVKACKWWANIGIGKHRYIWNDIPMMQFGDWIAPDVHTMNEWQARCKWTGTGSLAATSGLLSKIAGILGEKEDEVKYQKLHDKVSDAYSTVLMKDGKLLNQEFQTGYVLPLYFDMLSEADKKNAAQNLVELVKKSDYCIGTGFPGTPYILFALNDNGQKETAFKMLLNDKCPSWLYEVKAGGTTIWEHWDALREDGSVNGGEDDGTGGMSSFNHYASGAVGDFLYKRVAGIEPTDGGYKTFNIAPVFSDELKYAKGVVETPYGKIVSDWKNGEKFEISVEVPVGTTCTLTMPSGEQKTLGSGKYTFAE